MQSPSCIVFLAVLCGSMPAQMSGSYLVDPAAGPTAFPTITAAVNALFINGVSGPVEVVIAAGAYGVSVVLPPIAGASATVPVTLRSLSGPGTVHITGSSDNFALLGVDFMPNVGLVFDGLDFDGAPLRYAISGAPYTDRVEIRNCSFAAGYRNHIFAENVYDAAGWRVHHNRFAIPGRAYSIYLAAAHTWQIHHNAFELSSSTGAIYLGNLNAGFNAIHDNLFAGTVWDWNSTYGPLAGGQWPFYPAVIRSDLANYGNEIMHNTFVISIPTEGCCLGAGGSNFVRGNVFFLRNAGTCINSDSPFSVSDCNLFWAPNGEVGRLHFGANPVSQGFPTLAAWRTATAQDGASIAADPLLANINTPPFDLHPLAGSPVRDACSRVRSYLTTDFDDRLRDALLDLGAYELSNFAIFGGGCRGSGAAAPSIGGSGAVALGSTITLSLANARPSTFALLASGRSRTIAGSIALPFDLGGGCFLLVSPDATLGIATAPTGAAAVSFGIPTNPALLGTSAYFQWLVVDAAAPSRYGLAVSNAGALQL